jgi:hypothetical protein
MGEGVDFKPEALQLVNDKRAPAQKGYGGAVPVVG